MAILEIKKTDNILKKFRRLALVMGNYIHWRWRFSSFGWQSRLGRCDMLTNPGAISIGRKVEIRKGARLEAISTRNSSKVKMFIGDGTSILFYFHCGAAELVSIGKNVLIASHVYITDHDHDYGTDDLPPGRSRKLVTAPVVIEDGAWLGEGCMILKGVTIGKRAIVGANAVVTKNVEPFTKVAGVPAQPVGRIEPSSGKISFVAVNL